MIAPGLEDLKCLDHSLLSLLLFEVRTKGICVSKNAFFNFYSKKKKPRRGATRLAVTVWRFEDVQGHTGSVCRHVHHCVRVFLCVSDRGDQVQLCLVFISATQKEAGGWRRQTEKSWKGEENKKQANTCLCFSPCVDEMLPRYKHTQPVCGSTKTYTRFKQYFGLK